MKLLLTTAIIHCGIMPYYNISINQWLISKWNSPMFDSTTNS